MAVSLIGVLTMAGPLAWVVSVGWTGSTSKHSVVLVESAAGSVLFGTPVVPDVKVARQQ